MDPQQEETDFGGSALSKQRRVIHFSSGETLEEDEDGSEDEETEPTFSERARSSWKTVVVLVGRMSLMTCDFLGEKFAGLLGLRAAKYQYAIDQYHRDQEKKLQNQTTVSSEGGQRETIHLSETGDRSSYGATGTMRTSAGRQRSLDERLKDSDKGFHNKGYQAED